MLRRTLLALAVSALALGLVACGGVRETLDPVASAAEKSTAAGSVRVSIDASFSAGGMSGRLVAAGVFDDDEGELTIDASNLLGQLGGGLAGSDGVMKVITTTQDGHPVVYAQLPSALSMLPGGKSWIKADVEKAASLAGGDAGQLLGLSGQSPDKTLELLGKAGTVTEVGTETLDGADVTHYRVTVDLAQALEQQGVPAATVQALIATGVSTKFPIEVWIGTDDGYVHKIHFSYDATVQGQQISAELTMTMSDWGTGVAIDVPSDDEVFDVTALALKLGKS